MVPSLLARSVALLLAATPAFGQTVTDGDTIKVSGERYRLWGIDAPEKRQTCHDGWPAGAEATRFLRGLMRSGELECEPRTKDRYGRTVALCRAGGRDLGAEMVRAGLAWAFVKYSSDYVSEEQAARQQRQGIHSHDCEPAWEWRALKRTRH
jgi:endonuclease YncB( thermonuclease family)